MPTATSQVNRSERGYVSRGPERWKRARLNAEKYPNSKAAQLYNERVTLGEAVAAACDVAPSKPWVHFTFTWEDAAAGRDDDPKRRAYTCCSAHAAMQVSLDTHKLDGVLFAMRSGAGVRVLDPSILTRDVRCQVCATTIKRTTGKRQPPRVVTKVVEIVKTDPRDNWIVTHDGSMVRAEGAYLVDFTEREAEIVQVYVNRENRSMVATRYGRPLDA